MVLGIIPNTKFVYSLKEPEENPVLFSRYKNVRFVCAKVIILEIESPQD